MELKIYKSYGVLAHEYHPIYSIFPASDIYDEITVQLPDGWSVAESVSCDTLIISPDGERLLANDILTNFGDDPALCLYDGNSHHTIKLSRR